MRANIYCSLCARHHPKCCAHINSFNAHDNRIKEGLWMTPLFARWKDWAPERLISLLLIFSISSSNSTCWQKLHSWLPRTFSYFKFKISLEFLRPLLFPGWFSSSWGSCSIMTPGEGIRSLVAIICRTTASAEMFSPVWSSAQMDDPAGQRLLRGLKSHLVPSHTAHTLTTVGLLTKRPLQAHLLSLCFLAIDLPSPSREMWNRVCSPKACSARKRGRQAVEALSVLTHSVALSTYPQGHLTGAVGKPCFLRPNPVHGHKFPPSSYPLTHLNVLVLLTLPQHIKRVGGSRCSFLWEPSGIWSSHFCP